jgi:hypothetical protein
VLSTLSTTMAKAPACYLGWQESLRNLARLVEPEINQ